MIKLIMILFNDDGIGGDDDNNSIDNEFVILFHCFFIVPEQASIFASHIDDNGSQGVDGDDGDDCTMIKTLLFKIKVL